MVVEWDLMGFTSGKLSHNNGQSTILQLGKSSISMDYHWSLNVFKLVEILVGDDGPIEIDGLPN